MRRLALLTALAGTLIAAAPAQAAGHWCRQGDPPLRAGTRTSCAFAGQVITDWVNGDCVRRCTGRVYSRAARHTFYVSCTRHGGAYGTVTCHGDPGHGIYVRFSADI